MSTEIEALMQAHQTMLANQIEQAAKIDGLELLLASVGARGGIDAAEFTAKLRIAQGTFHEKRLQLIAARNPKTAAAMDNRQGVRLVDEELLLKVEIGTPPGLSQLINFSPLEK